MWELTGNSSKHAHFWNERCPHGDQSREPQIWATEPAVLLLLARDHREKTTPSRICLPYNLSSCRVIFILPRWLYFCWNFRITPSPCNSLSARNVHKFAPWYTKELLPKIDRKKSWENWGFYWIIFLQCHFCCSLGMYRKCKSLIFNFPSFLKDKQIRFIVNKAYTRSFRVENFRPFNYRLL